MRRLIVLICLGFFLVGCSALKKRPNNVYIEETRSFFGEELVKKNLFKTDFDIQKIGIETISSNGNQSFLANLKYRANGNYLISIRSKVGMELARISISSDSTFIYDRINKNLYEGGSNNFLGQYGFNMTVLPVIFGDIVVEGINSYALFECNMGKTSISGKSGDTDVEYIIDCGHKRPQEISIKNFNTGTSTIILTDYKNIEEFYFPSNVSIKIEAFDYRINMKFDNIAIEPGTEIIFNIPENVQRTLLH